MDRVTHLEEYGDHLSVSYATNKVTRSIFVELNIYILNDAYVNIQLQYKQWSSSSLHA